MKKYFMLISLMLLFSPTLTGCGTMPVKNNDTVKLHYSVILEDGIVFETSLGSEPLEVTLGQGEVLPYHLIGMVANRMNDR